MRQDAFRPLPDDAAARCDPSDDPSTTRTPPMSAAASSMLRRRDRPSDPNVRARPPHFMQWSRRRQRSVIGAGGSRAGGRSERCGRRSDSRSGRPAPQVTVRSASVEYRTSAAESDVAARKGGDRSIHFRANSGNVPRGMRVYVGLLVRAHSPKARSLTAREGGFDEQYAQFQAGSGRCAQHARAARSRPRGTCFVATTQSRVSDTLTAG
jgi:hypothetical protein